MEIASNVVQIKNKIKLLESQNLSFVNSVSLLAVSKKKSIADIEEAIHAGQFSFGENYVQEAVEKIQALKKYPSLEWHYIGRVQKNKLKQLALYFDWVQSIETKEVAEKLNQACEKINRKLNVCLQVNISAEPQKGGVKNIEVQSLAKYIVEQCPCLCLRGLMAIGLSTLDENSLKEMFSRLRSCYDIVRKKYTTVDILSMGMSGDMALAIACGSTMVRIGTAIFGERVK